MAQHGLNGETDEAVLDDLEHTERQPLTASDAPQPTSAYFP